MKNKIYKGHLVKGETRPFGDIYSMKKHGLNRGQVVTKETMHFSGHLVTEEQGLSGAI